MFLHNWDCRWGHGHKPGSSEKQNTGDFRLVSSTRKISPKVRGFVDPFAIARNGGGRTGKQRGGVQQGSTGYAKNCPLPIRFASAAFPAQILSEGPPLNYRAKTLLSLC